MISHLSRRLLLLAILAPALAAGIRGAAAAPDSGTDSDICRAAIFRTEESYKLPVGILHAISLAESGRWDRETRTRSAWPWTVTARGKGQFYPSRAAAIAAVRALRAEGVRNIDVGCMQINLMYHPKAFGTLEEAFDPAANSRYAADLFSRLREANRSLTRAIAHYHSTTREYNVPYTRKVIDLWNEERRRIFAEDRERKIEAWRIERERQIRAAQARR